MSSSSKKRKESTSPSKEDVARMGADADESPRSKKPLLDVEDAGIASSKEYADVVLNRAPLNVSLKRIGKRGHEGIEKPVKLLADEGLSAKNDVPKVGGEVAPPIRKQAPSRVDFHSSLASPQVHVPMATNLRASLRGSNGPVGQKQVKKLVIKSTLGMQERSEMRNSLLSPILAFQFVFDLSLTSHTIPDCRGSEDWRRIPHYHLAQAPQSRKFDPLRSSRRLLLRRTLLGTSPTELGTHRTAPSCTRVTGAPCSDNDHKRLKTNPQNIFGSCRASKAFARTITSLRFMINSRPR